MQNNTTLENELQRILANYLSETSNTANQFNNNTYTHLPRVNTRTNFNTPTTQNNIYSVFNNILNSLRENMNQYHANNAAYLNLLNTILTNETLLNTLNGRNHANPLNTTPNTPHRDSTFRRDYSNLFNNTSPIRSQTRNTVPTNNSFDNLFAYGISLIPNSLSFQNVIVRPTQEQINAATVTLEYNTSLNLVNNSCPISLERFNNGDEIIQIIHCGHCFQPSNFNTWFANNTRCPVCRYDIRDYNPPAENADSDLPSDTSQETTDQTNNTDNDNHPFHSIFSDLDLSNFNANTPNNTTNNVSTFFDGSNNLALRLEIPLTFTQSFDMSDNSV